MIGLGQETGCTDSSSLEYDSLAIKDDGSCLYDISCLFYSNDSNTAYIDFSKTKKVTGWVEMNEPWCTSKKQLIDGKSTNKYTLSEWLENPCPGNRTVVYWLIIFFIWIPLTYISSYRTIKYLFPFSYIASKNIIWILILICYIVSFNIGLVEFVTCIDILGGFFIILWIILGLERVFNKKKSIDKE